MKRVKYLLLLIAIIFMLSGCTAQVNIKINKNNTVTEEVIIKNHGLSKEEVKNEIKNIKSEIKGYEYNIFDDKVTFTKKYENVCDYAKNTFMAYNYFSEIKCSENTFDYNINAITMYKEENSDMCEPGSDVCSTEGMIGTTNGNYIVNLESDLKIIDENSNYNSNGVYVWDLNSTNGQDLNIKVKKNNIKLKYTVIGSILSFVIIIFAITILISKYRKTKVDY